LTARNPLRSIRRTLKAAWSQPFWTVNLGVFEACFHTQTSNQTTRQTAKQTVVCAAVSVSAD
jgi:hypothetical protein